MSTSMLKSKRKWQQYILQVNKILKFCQYTAQYRSFYNITYKYKYSKFIYILKKQCYSYHFYIQNPKYKEDSRLQNMNSLFFYKQINFYMYNRNHTDFYVQIMLKANEF